MVAAALQDSGRAVLVGSASYGKATVQTVLPLPNSGEFLLTWARFHAPSGYALHRRGLQPDICTTGEVTSPADPIARIQTGSLHIPPDFRRPDVATENDTSANRPHSNKIANTAQ